MVCIVFLINIDIVYTVSQFYFEVVNLYCIAKINQILSLKFPKKFKKVYVEEFV